MMRRLALFRYRSSANNRCKADGVHKEPWTPRIIEI
jgi:hypothetical protein